MNTSSTADDLFLRLMREAGKVSDEQCREAAEQAAAPENELTSPYRILIERGLIDPAETARVLAAKFALRTVEIASLMIPAEVLALITQEQALRYQLLPLRREGDVLHVAMADPLATEGVDELAHLLGLSIEAAIAAEDELSQAITRHYGREHSEFDEILSAETVAPPHSMEPDQQSEATDADGPIIKLVESMIADAVKLRASDIHVEPLERRLRVRFRVDGVLVAGPTPPKRLQAVIISRLKIMAGISIAEKRLPQDGRIQIKVEGRDLDLRVSSLPTSHGEGIVMRILDQESLKFGLAELGFFPDDEAIFKKLISQPDGIFLVTGPTGSGKTTTLYSCLHEINRPDQKIITVEDPVEYQMSGINQVPVRNEVGMTFAAALRAMLRQAPNIVMVGEIRDLETAEIAIHASLTGHMVFSTLHTNDAPGAVTRLVDIGVKPFLVSTSLSGVMAQRLVRKVCPDCAAPYEPDEQQIRQLNITPEIADTANFRKGKGCPSCHGTGYRGRMGIFELLVIDDDLRMMIHGGVSVARIREKARIAGMRTLREDGVRKVIAGLTTIEEVVSITIGDSS